MFELVCDINNLYKAFLKIKSTSMWKEETQRYEIFLIPNLKKLKDSLINGTYRPSEPRGFFMNERGKPRYIESRCVQDRIVQCVVHEQVILPAIRNKLIYDNSASLEDRGTSHFRSRLEYHLSSFASMYGDNGYILLIDFQKYFDNIWHDVYLGMLQPLIPDERCFNLIKILVYNGAVDVSYMTDEEYSNCMYVPFNNLEYRLKVKSGEIKCTGEKFMYKGMGLGSQISQDAGIFVPHIIDNNIKIVHGIKWYGRYMDDSYVMHPSKDYLRNLLNEITAQANSIGIFINAKKTQIVNLKHEFTILQTRYKLHSNGSITIMPNNDTFIREHSKLKKQANMLDDPSCKITYDDIENQFKAWKGNILVNTDNHYVKGLQKMDDYYNELFINDFINQGGYV